MPSGDHPSGHTVAGCLERFTRRLGRAALEHLRSRTASDATFNLAPGGVYLATPVTRGAGALLPHRFTLTCLERQAVCFLWHCPASCLGLPLTTALLCGVRTFLGPRPVRGTRWFQKPRPPGQLVRPRMLPGACRWPALWSPYDSYVALLRGINVGGINIKMADLARVFGDLGFQGVKTVLASGNVLFDSPSTDIPTLKKQIESSLAREFGYEAWVFVLDIPTLQAIVDNYPFEREREGWHAYAMVASEPEILEELSTAAAQLDASVERVAAGDGVLYWEVEKGQTVKSAFGRNTGKPKFKAFTTTRNLNTLYKLLK